MVGSNIAFDFLFHGVHQHMIFLRVCVCQCWTNLLLPNTMPANEIYFCTDHLV